MKSQNQDQFGPGILIILGLLISLSGFLVLLGSAFIGSIIPETPLGLKEGLYGGASSIAFLLFIIGLFTGIAGIIALFSSSGRRGMV